MSSKLLISEQELRKIVDDETLSFAMMNEGIWDDVKDGAIKLRKLTTNKFGNAISKWVGPLKKLLAEHDSQKSNIDQGFGLIKDAMSKSGESFHMDKVLIAAKKLSQMSSDDAINIVQEELKTGPHELAQKLQAEKKESVYMAGCYSVLAEHNTLEGIEQLNESLGVTTVAGLILGGFGGLHLLFNGLSKLASFLHMKKSAEMFGHWSHILHHTEEAILDKVVPNKLAYFFYKIARTASSKIVPFVIPKRRTPFKYKEFVDNKEIRMQVKKAMYKLLLAWLLFHGITGAVKAGMSIMGIAEGTASAVKGVEIATGVSELIALSRGYSTKI